VNPNPLKQKHLFSALILFLLIAVACEKYEFTDENDELLRKSFPRITNINIQPFSSEAFISFSIEDEESNDPVKDRKIIFWEPDQPIGNTTVGDSTNNFITIPDLQPNTTYEGVVRVETSVKILQEENLFFYSDTFEFKTLPIAVNIESIIVNEQQLKVTAYAIIEDYDPSLNATNLFFTWKSSNGNTITTQANGISGKGRFNSELRYFDFSSASFEVTAFATIDQQSIPSVPSPFFLDDLEGDFWVNMTKLEPFDNGTNTIYPSIIGNIPALEGAVSFEHGGYVYLGLGRVIDNQNFAYPNQFYRYDPRRNSWETTNVSLINGKGRMFAFSFKSADGHIYLGGGCNPCEDYDTWDGEIDPSERLSGIKVLSDFYRFDGSDFMRVGSIPAGRFAGNALNLGNEDFLIGGIEKKEVQGDIQEQGYEDDQFDPGEWHDIDEDGSVDAKTFQPHLPFIEAEFCDLLSSTSRRRLFCRSCGVDQGNVFYKVSSSVTGDRNEISYELVDNVGQKYFQETLANGLNVLVRIDNDLNEYIWQDRNDDGRIQFQSELKDNMGNPGPRPTSHIAILSKATTDPNEIVWERQVSAGQNSIRVVLSTGSSWCDQNNDNKIQLSEIFIDPDEPEFDEWLDADQDGVPAEVAQILTVQNQVWTLENNSWETGSMETVRPQYGAAALRIASDVYFVAGDQIIPSTNQNPSIYRFDGSSFHEVEPMGNSMDFGHRVHPFHFVINGKGYVGGGENSEGPVPFDHFEFSPMLNELKRVTACGIPDMARGTGFSFEGKGFIFGKSLGERQFWVYIPKL